MDNGALVFIIVFEAIAIVWLLSKLKQYENFEDLLKRTHRSEEPTAGRESTLSQAPSSSDKPEYVAAISEEELMQVPGVEPELNIEEAKRVQLVMARCRYAEFYLEQLDDDYERGQFKLIINSATAIARSITDPFFKANALHPLITLLDSAGWEDSRDELIAEVKDEHVLNQIHEAVGAESAGASV